MIGTETLDRVIGADVYDADGDKIGTASEVYLDDQSGTPEWVTVKTGLFGTKQSFVPIREADLTGDGLRVPVSKEKVKDAPKIDTDGHLSPDEEQELYRYYGTGAGGTGSMTTTGQGGSAGTAGFARPAGAPRPGGGPGGGGGAPPPAPPPPPPPAPGGAGPPPTPPGGGRGPAP